MIAKRSIGRRRRLWARLETIRFWYSRVFAGVSTKANKVAVPFHHPVGRSSSRYIANEQRRTRQTLTDVANGRRSKRRQVSFSSSDRRGSMMIVLALSGEIAKVELFVLRMHACSRQRARGMEDSNRVL